jgi:hypothetical protein
LARPHAGHFFAWDSVGAQSNGTSPLGAFQIPYAPELALGRFAEAIPSNRKLLLLLACLSPGVVVAPFYYGAENLRQSKIDCKSGGGSWKAK